MKNTQKLLNSSRLFVLPSVSGRLRGSGWRCQWVWRDKEFDSGCFCWFCHRRAHTDAPVSALPFLQLKAIGDILPATSRGKERVGGPSVRAHTRTHTWSTKVGRFFFFFTFTFQVTLLIWTFVPAEFPACVYALFHPGYFLLLWQRTKLLLSLCITVCTLCELFFAAHTGNHATFTYK